MRERVVLRDVYSLTHVHILTLRYEEGEEWERTGMGQVWLPALESHLETASRVIVCVERSSNFHSCLAQFERGLSLPPLTAPSRSLNSQVLL